MPGEILSESVISKPFKAGAILIAHPLKRSV
jgi:hypothetical protein